MMDISVVIGSYNQCVRLRRVLEGFFAQETTYTFELIVIDSLSTDGTQEMLADVSENLDVIQFKYESRDNPSGKAEARNYGVSLASSDLIIITDADMIPDKHFVHAHIVAHKQARKVCCFQGLAYNLDTYDWPPDLSQATPQVPKKYSDGASLIGIIF